MQDVDQPAFAQILSPFPLTHDYFTYCSCVDDKYTQSENWFWLVLSSLSYHRKLLKQAHRYSETRTSNLRRKDFCSSGRKVSGFSAFFFLNLTSTFYMTMKIKTAISVMKSLKKSKEKKGFSTTLKNKKTNFWLVWRQERPGISSTKWIMKFLSSKYDGTQMYIS